MGERVVETLIGAAVLVVAGAFFAYAYTRSNLHSTSGYELGARFGSVGSLAVGSDVRISGIKVGTVTRESLNPETYLAEVRMTIDPHIKVPDDSSVRIAQDGLLGGNYMVIEPGGSEEILRPGGTIVHTQGAVDLLSLVGQAIFSAGKGGGASDGGAKPESSGAAPALPTPLLEVPAVPESQPRAASPAEQPAPAPAAPAAEPHQDPNAGQQALPPQPAPTPAP
jgi:phospholipid/cholesterol/gamma-HCH transport system substrate-binding protein